MSLTVEELVERDVEELVFLPGAWRYKLLGVDETHVRLRTESGNVIEFSRADLDALLERESIQVAK